MSLLEQIGATFVIAVAFSVVVCVGAFVVGYIEGTIEARKGHK